MLSDLFAHGALPRSGRSCLLSHAEAGSPLFVDLLERGWIWRESTDEAGVTSCGLTEQGVSCMVTCKTAVPQSRALQATPSEDDAAMSTHELLTLVFEKGWKWKLPIPRKRIMPYKAGGEKCFYTRQRAITTVYLRALLKADACEDPEQLLYHGQAASYYHKYLAGEAGNAPPQKRARVVPIPLAGGDCETADVIADTGPPVYEPQDQEAQRLMDPLQAEESLEEYIEAMLEGDEYMEVQTFGRKFKKSHRAPHMLVASSRVRPLASFLSLT